MLLKAVVHFASSEASAFDSGRKTEQPSRALFTPKQSKLAT
jgi:hypothetical protein